MSYKLSVRRKSGGVKVEKQTPPHERRKISVLSRLEGSSGGKLTGDLTSWDSDHQGKEAA